METQGDRAIHAGQDEQLTHKESNARTQLATPQPATNRERDERHGSALTLLPTGWATPTTEAHARAEQPLDVHPALLAREVASLNECQILYTSGRYLVAVARREQVPNIVEEIGRLREIAFRAVGEGTGKDRDLDVYDDHYRHLFVWEADTQRVLGAYRLAMTDVVLQAHGTNGLYTNSLFLFRPDFFDRLGPAIELGRSFVRPEYQRASRVLAMLWKGIGRLVSLRPKYSTLFGPVSISASYSEASRQWMAHTLSRGGYRHELWDSVEANRPLPPLEAPSFDYDPDLNELHAHVASLEQDGKGVPTLVREYAKLGGRFLSFSIDPDFGNAMDGLVAVDLRTTNPRLLSLYMGAEAYAQFRAVA